MAKRIINNIRLGAFVLGGLLFLILLLYMIGENEHLFGATYNLTARLTDAQGLVKGNNVRFSGLNVGTVKEIRIQDDATIVITMVIDKKMLPVIRKNAIVSIGTEGLVGNKVINITPSKEPGIPATEGDLLATKKAINTDDILETLSHTNNDVAIIAAGLKTTVQRINNSTLWSLMDDKSLPEDLKISIAHIRTTTSNATVLVNNLNSVITDVKNGKGSIGSLLKDTSFAVNIGQTICRIKLASGAADSLISELNKTAAAIHESITDGKGTVHALLNDTAMVKKLNASLDNIQKGTDGFNQNMEALKHNFLLRGYFRKLEKQKK